VECATRSAQVTQESLVLTELISCIMSSQGWIYGVTHRKARHSLQLPLSIPVFLALGTQSYILLHPLTTTTLTAANFREAAIYLLRFSHNVSRRALTSIKLYVHELSALSVVFSSVISEKVHPFHSIITILLISTPVPRGIRAYQKQP